MHVNSKGETSMRIETSHRGPDPMNRNTSLIGDGVTICHYFPGMVREAIKEARATLTSARAVSLKGWSHGTP
jgi:hypothetical protein